MAAWIWLAWLWGCSGGSSGVGASPSGGGTEPEPAGEVLAKVGDGFVSEAEFASAASRVQQPGEELSLEDRKEVLDKLVTEEILFQEALEKGLYRDPKVRKIMVNLLLRQEVYDNVRSTEISTEDLQAFYEAHKAEFTVPEKVQIKRIFLKTGGEGGRTEADAMTLAKELQGKIKKDPAQFKVLAEQHSDDPYKRRGGDLGYVARDGKPGVPPEVIETAFALAVGQVSDPFVAGEGVNLVLVAAKRQASERTFDQMKGSVLRQMKNERFQELTDQYIAKAKNGYSVSIDEKALSAVKIEARPAAPMDPSTLLPGVGPRPERGGIKTPGEELLEEMGEEEGEGEP
jgi:parvulin-like peptidyl-prolyl isomerase